MDSNKIAVVTGASRGIGSELAVLLADSGYITYNLSRSANDSDKVRHIECDVACEEQVGAAMAQIVQEHGRIDLLVCNAGYGIGGTAEFTAAAESKSLFDVNYFGAVNSVKAALPALREVQGRVVLVSSAASPFPLPFQAHYSASKAAICAFGLALAGEVRQFGVSVTVALPGDVRTSFTNSRSKTDDGDGVYGGASMRSINKMEREEQQGMTPQYAARKLLKMCTRRKVKPMYVIGGKYKVMYVAQKFVPARLTRWLVNGMYGG